MTDLAQLRSQLADAALVWARTYWTNCERFADVPFDPADPERMRAARESGAAMRAVMELAAKIEALG